MEFYTAEEWFVQDPDLFRRFYEVFASSGSLAVGGQAGIAAQHLAGIGSPRVICASPRFNPEASRVLAHAGVIMPVTSTSPGMDQEPDHLVFEYGPGLVPPAPGIRPRHNRFIVSPAHSAASVILPEPLVKKLHDIAGSCTRGFFSGYQYLRTRRDFEKAANQLTELKDHNRSLHVHAEWVSVTDERISRLFARHILPHADSLGLNGQELLALLSHLRGNGECDLNEGTVSPSRLFDAALDLHRELGIRRIHIHTLGYYIVVLDRTEKNPVGSRTALLYASRKTAEAAQGNHISVSTPGLRAVGAAARKFRGESPGIFSAGDCTILVIPTLVVRNVRKTAGLGDILSSTAFAAEIF